MNLDPTIRHTLQSYANHAPSSAGLLAGARARAHQRRRHRHLASAGLAAVAAAAAVAGWGLLPDRAGDGPVVALPPAASATLVPAEYEVPAVPFSPGWTPEEAGDPYAGYHMNSPVAGDQGFWLAHDHRDGSGRRVISFDVSTGDISHLFAERGDDHATEEVVVQDRPATLHTIVEEHTGDEAVAVSWRHHENLWVTVYGDTSGAEDVLRYADALVEEPFRLAPAVAFEVLPADAELAYLTVSEVTFNLPDNGRLGVHLGYDDGSGPVWGTSMDPDADTGVATPRVDPTMGADIPVPQQGEVAGRPAEWVEDADGSQLRIFYPDELWVLTVYSSLPATDLLRIAEGIGLTENAQPQRIG